MVEKETLRKVVFSQKNREKNTGITREITYEVNLDDDRIIILSGIRRVGKTTILYQLMEKVDNFCYFNFDDERLTGFEMNEFERLNEILIEFYGDSEYYFFDEIQNVSGWERFVRRLQDEGKKVIVTGSNASLLSSEFGTHLTGRYKLYEVFPLSFKEFLRFNDFNLDSINLLNSKDKVSLVEQFKKYLNKGGMPQYLKNEDEDYVKTLFENIIYRDIVSRYSLKSSKYITELSTYLVTNLSKLTTYNSLKNMLGLSNASTVKNYIQYLNNSYLFFELNKFDYSLKKQLRNPKKVYLVDNSFKKILGFNFSKDIGRLLENLVFVELKRRGKNIYYHKENKECDFVLKDGNDINQAYQICYSLNDENRDREVEGLFDALKSYNLDEGIILTYDQKEEISYKNKKMKVIPVWFWLIEN
ncbi:MAG: ATP-binding protein [Candidatus Woesearchaeota archaeon]